MKMLMITKGITSEYFHKHTDLIDFLTARKYETPIIQEFRTGHVYSVTVLPPIWVCVYYLFF